VTYKHVNAASSLTRLQLMDEGGKPGEPDKHGPDIPEPPALEDPGAGAAPLGAALLEMPALTPRTTKSRSKLPVSLPSRGPAPTTSMPAVSCNAPPALSTFDTGAIIGRLGDVTGRTADDE
jgi:hypothetical protein